MAMELPRSMMYLWSIANKPLPLKKNKTNKLLNQYRSKKDHYCKKKKISLQIKIAIKRYESDADLLLMLSRNISLLSISLDTIFIIQECSLASNSARLIKSNYEN